jgi:hypothetical protein
VTEWNTCPRCLRSGVGACDDFPDCQPSQGIMQIIPVNWEPGQIAETTPEERIEAAQRYLKARYGDERPFAFPGEGMIINGALITPDTPLIEGQLEHIVGWGKKTSGTQEGKENDY